MRQRATLAKATITLSLLLLMFILPSGSAGGDRAGAQETTNGGRTSPPGAVVVPEPPVPEAQVWSLTDADSGLYLTGKNPDERLPMASTANIMTALVALEEGIDLDEEVEVSPEAESYVGTTYSNVGLITGEHLTVRDLLAAALIPSGTDAVYALAEHLGDGSVDDFVEKMNTKASSMGLEDTRFQTPAGLDATGDYSSAQDLATLARTALQYPLFAEIVDTAHATINTQNREIEISNTNQLLTTYPKATGVKTGASPEAGANLVASAKDGDEYYIAVVLGAEDSEQRFRAAEAILEYGFGRYERRSLLSEGEVYEELPLPYRGGESVKLTATEEVVALVAPDSEVEHRVTGEEPPPAAEAGQELGEVEVFVGGQRMGRSPLVARTGYEEASLWDKAWYAVEWPAKRVWDSLWG